MGMLREKMVESGTILTALTETHLNPNILDAECCIENYDLYRADRGQNRSKGGVAMYIRSDVAGSSKLICSGSNGVVEYQMVHIRQYNVVIINIYRPPTAKMTEFSPIVSTLKEKLDELDDHSASLVICGDFNFPRTCFHTGTTSGGSDEERRQAGLMIDLQEELLLRQVVNRPSREDSFLDLIFTNNEDIFGVVDAEDSIMTDHRILSIQTFLETPLVTCTLRALDGFEALNFHHRAVKWDDMTIELAEVDWSGELAQHDVEDMFEAFRRVLLGVCGKYVPRRTMRGNRRSRIPRDRKILMRKRCKLRKKMERELNPIQSSTLKNQLKELELKISKSHEDEMMRVEGEAIDAIRDNSKFFFTYAQSKAKTRTGIGPLSNGTELVQDPLEMSELLRVQYESVFTSPLATRPNNILEHLERETLENFHLELSDFHKAAKTLRNGSSAGPDGIPALLIKKLIGVLAEPFKVIWTESMQTGVIPRILKRGKITPIYKGGDRMIASNYRPVTLTSHCIKMYEKIIVQKMTRYLEDNNLYNSGQHGFRGGRSCLTQLIDHQMNILE